MASVNFPITFKMPQGF